MKPFKFKNNRVWRVYKGGALIDKTRGAPDPKDDLFPEDWIASTVLANNPQRNLPNEGLSVALLPEGERMFADILSERAAECLGEAHSTRYGSSTAFLTKLLDSATRLPLQAHPDDDAARRLYASEFGKTEAWIVIETRVIDGVEPYLIMGFGENLDVETFKKESIRGDMPKSLEMTHRHLVKPGDVFILKGGLVHAIGPGVMMMEIMQPTDLVVQPEAFCDGQPLTMSERFGDASPEKALEVFDFTPKTAERVLEECRLNPKTVVDDDQAKLETLIDENEIGFFGASRLVLDGEFESERGRDACEVGVVIDGECELLAENAALTLKTGETFFIPASVETRDFRGNAEILLARPPHP